MINLSSLTENINDRSAHVRRIDPAREIRFIKRTNEGKLKRATGKQNVALYENASKTVSRLTVLPLCFFPRMIVLCGTFVRKDNRWKISRGKNMHGLRYISAVLASTWDRMQFEKMIVRIVKVLSKRLLLSFFFNICLRRNRLLPTKRPF